MYNSRLGLNIPKFKVTAIPDLEAALNSLSDSIKECAEKIPNFQNSRNILVYQDGSNVFFEALSEYIPPQKIRFKVGFDESAKKIYVDEGRVGFIVGTTVKVVIPTINGKKICNSESADYDNDDPNGLPPLLDGGAVTDGAEWGVYLKVKGYTVEVVKHRNDDGPISGDADLFLQLATIKKVTIPGAEAQGPMDVYIVDQKWTSDAVLSGGTSGYCPFRVSDASDEDGLKIKVQVDKLDIPGYEGDPYPLPFPDNGYKDEIYNLTRFEDGHLRYEYFYVYLVIFLDENGNPSTDYSSPFQIRFSSILIPTSGSRIRRTLICRFRIAKDSEDKQFLTEFINLCPIPAYTITDNNCLFEIEDYEYSYGSGDDPSSSCFITIKPSKVNGVYPLCNGDPLEPLVYRYLLLTNNALWYAIYLRVTLDGEGNIDTSLDNPYEIVSEISYKNSDTYYEYHLLGEVTLSYTSGYSPILYISHIKNMCLISGEVGGQNKCNFYVSDYSQYDENGVNPIEAVVRVKKSLFYGKLPSGMEAEEPFTISITDNDVDEAGICYIYATALIDPYEQAYNFDGSVYIEYGKYWSVNTGHSLRRALIAKVETTVVDGTRVLVPQKIANYCPVETKVPSCKFQVDDVSSLIDDKVTIQIKSGSINGRYPFDMNDADRLTLELSEEQNWYAVYLKAEYAPNGVVYEGYEHLYFTIENDYKKSNGFAEYYLIAEVTISYREDSSRYISYIQNYCYQPELVTKRSCAFEVFDVTEENTVAVVVRSDKIHGDFPTGMSYDEHYYLELDTTKSEWFSIYCELYVDQANTILSSAIVPHFTYKSDTTTTKRILIAEATVLYDESSKPYLYIENFCVRPSVSSAGYCTFEVTDATDEEGNMMVEVNYGEINNKVPDGMHLGTPYLLDVEATGRVYLYTKFNLESLNVDSSADSVSIFYQEGAPLSNTQDATYTLVATVVVENGSIKKITNTCNVTISPCNLAY